MSASTTAAPAADADPATVDGDVVVRAGRPALAVPAVRVLTLHGLASSPRVWGGLAGAAPARWEVLQAELPWAAGRPAFGADRDVAGPLWRALDAAGAGVDVLVAHSFGATCTLAALGEGGADALRRRGVRGVVLLSPFYRPSAGDFDWPTLSYYLNGFHRILEEGLRVEERRPRDPELRRAMALRVRDRVGPSGWVRFFETYLRTAELVLSAVDLPFLVVAGARDVAAFPSDAAALAQALPDCRLHELPRCGHFPMVEAPETVARLVDAFIEETLTRPSTSEEDRA